MMGKQERRLPIGVQDFEKLRKTGFVYVDKTRYIHMLAHGSGMQFFLSRPRRFGKSLFLSTLRSYWEGKKELFQGLAIEELEDGDPEAFAAHPVFYFDFNQKNYQRPTALEETLSDQLSRWEQVYGDEFSDLALEERFQHLLQKAVEQTGQAAVVLVDEYDKPLLEVMEEPSLLDHNRSVFKGFFSTLKSHDRYIRFSLLTGVTKFSQVSIFSDLNHLVDISMEKRFSGICGITEAELHEYLLPEVERMAEVLGSSQEDCLALLKKTYDGYHFTSNSVGIYNPFSLLNALAQEEIRYYWFQTGTPTFLIHRLKASGLDIRSFTDGSLYEDAVCLMDYRAHDPDPLPLLYQTGYLTILDFEDGIYTLGYPNEEVKYGFVKSLAPAYLYLEEEPSALSIFLFKKDLERADLTSLRDRFAALFARLPYPAENTEKLLERDFQNVVYLVFLLLGQNVHTEVHSAKGRADCIVEMKEHIYLFEFKRDGSAEEALAQIGEKGYARPYAADPRQLHRIGASFSSQTRTLDGWVTD